MPLATNWKTAKTTFEAATGKKKPSDKFLGVFRKGTSIEATLKDVDSAKTAADLRKALGKFTTVYTDYCVQLDKAAADPKTVPAPDKPAYVMAIKKLREDLKKIEADGAKIAETLGDAGKKDKVDPNALKEANEHLAMRVEAGKQAEQMVATYKGHLAKVNGHKASALKQLDAAKSAAKSSNTMLHQVAVGTIDRFLMEAEKVSGPARTVYLEKVTKGGSIMMDARQDCPDKITKGLPASVLATYTPKSKEAFRKLSGHTAELTTILNDIEATVQEIKAIHKQAEGAGNTLKDPKAYIAELTKLLETTKKDAKDASIKGDRIIKGNEAVAGIMKNTPEEQANWYRLQEDQWKRYEPDMKMATKTLTAYKAQASATHDGAREDARIDKLVKEIEEAAEDGLEYIQTVHLAGSQLVAKIKLQRGRLK